MRFRSHSPGRVSGEPPSVPTTTPAPKPLPTDLCKTMESVVLETSLGDIQLELYWDHAPKVGCFRRTSHKLLNLAFEFLDV